MKKFYSLLFIFSVLSLFSYSQRLIELTDLFKINMVNEVSVSPDGKLVAYTLLSPKHIDEGIGYRTSKLFLYDVNDEKVIDLSFEKGNVSSICWRPETSQICFRSNNSDTNGAQIFAIDVKSNEISQLTNFNKAVNSYKFLDENTIIYVMEQTPVKERQAMDKAGIDIKIFEEENLHLELFSYNILDNTSKKLVSDKTVYDFEISPDKSKIALALSEKNLVDYSYMFKKITIINAKNGNILRKFDNQGKLGKMAWSPDGKRLAFVAASHLHDAVCGSLFIMNVEDESQTYSDLQNLVLEKELSVTNISWQNNINLLYSAEEGVDISMYSLNTSNFSHNNIIPVGKIAFRRFDHHKDNFYFAANTINYPNELVKFNSLTAEFQKLTSHNDWLSEVKLSKQEKIEYKARDGKQIEGVLLYPVNYKEGEKYPLIVYIHGGPEAAVQNAWTTHYSTWGQFAGARDYFIFSPNYRASSGRGVDYTMAGFGDLLGVEYDDVIDGVNHLINIGKVDKEKVGIGGGSYGGFFAAYSATRHSEMFAAAVVFVGISNQISKRKTTDIPYEDYLVHWGFWTHEDYNKVWNASPVKYVKGSNTPTLILHGEDDPRIPVSQGLELYRGLKLHGNAPVRFIKYPGEGHGNAKNINRYDYLVRTLDWFDYYLKDNPRGTQTMPEKYINY